MWKESRSLVWTRTRRHKRERGQSTREIVRLLTFQSEFFAASFVEDHAYGNHVLSA